MQTTIKDPLPPKELELLTALETVIALYEAKTLPSDRTVTFWRCKTVAEKHRRGEGANS